MDFCSECNWRILEVRTLFSELGVAGSLGFNHCHSLGLPVIFKTGFSTLNNSLLKSRPLLLSNKGKWSLGLSDESFVNGCENT